MKKYILLLMLIALPIYVQAETKIIGIGDSIYARIFTAAAANPPANSSIVVTGNEANYSGSTLADWANDDTGLCDATHLYGCLEDNEPFDIIWIYGLGTNDWVGWYNGNYANMQTYLDAWRAFYKKLHSRFPGATIQHTTGYVFRQDSTGRSCTNLLGLDTWGGSLASRAEPDCANAQECVNQINGNIRGFKELLFDQNADLYYVAYHDSFEKIATFTDSDNWFDSYLPVGSPDDCLHMPPESYDRYYGRFLSSWFTHFKEPNETIINTDIINSNIN